MAEIAVTVVNNLFATVLILFHHLPRLCEHAFRFDVERMLHMVVTEPLKFQWECFS